MNAVPRIFVGGVAHETHTFSSVGTRVADFQAYEWAEGSELIHLYQGTRTSIGGILDGAESTGARIVPGFYTFAIPSGLVPASDYMSLRERYLAGLREAVRQRRVDAAILVCHGAMVAGDHPDVEFDLALHARSILGPNVPLAMTVDYHANVSQSLIEVVDLLVGYDTYPHVDVYERGYETARLTVDMIASKTTPTRVYGYIPILAVPQRQNTDVDPMRSILARVHEIEESDPTVLAISLLGGFCYSDVGRSGMAVVVHTRGNPDRAGAYAQELQASVWQQRAGFVQVNVPVAEAVSRVGASALPGPTILVDVADNIGGGAPGDGTCLLAEIVDRGVSGIAIAIADRQAVEHAFRIGVGGRFHADVGGKTDSFHGAPVSTSGTVKLLSDGRFTYRGSYMTGQVKEMGRTAVIDVGGSLLILSENKTMPFDQQQLRSVGISPEFCRAIVVKSATAWRAAYADLAGEVVEVNTPGICTADLPSLPFRAVRRPIFPLDEAFPEELPEISVYAGR